MGEEDHLSIASSFEADESSANDTIGSTADVDPSALVETFQHDIRGIYEDIELKLNIQRSSDKNETHLELLLKYKGGTFMDKGFGAQKRAVLLS